MRSVIRHPRGRSTKVGKPRAAAPTARRLGRGQGSPPKTEPYDEGGGSGNGVITGGDDADVGGGVDHEMVHGMDADTAAAAAAVAAAAEMDDDEADGEMEEDDEDPTGASTGLQHTQNVDLNTAANILANGGAGPTATLGQVQDAQNAHHSQHHPQEQHQQHQQLQQHHHQLAPPPQHHQPPAPMGDHTGPHNLDPAFIKTTEEMARESGYGNLNIDSGLAKRLAREPGLRLAQQRRPEQHLNLARRSNVEALFAHIAGELAPTPCKNCHKGHGPWNSCVVVDGQMCGSCANCWFNASGARCSFHEARNPQQTVHGVPSALLPPGSGAAPPDHAAAYGLQQNLPPPPGAAHSTLGALNLAAGMSSDPVVRFTIERAMADVRGADRKTRQIMMIEIAAKQLALQVIEYEESLAAEQQQHHHHHQQQAQQLQGGPAQGQQGLGGD
ncbi:hypothetical protein VTK73DRAFT_1987 [Phialemonium thermophilum]|uniref:Uncharacterized protein n=1 Tax=Phialemonium thermophilum TaxID=223376 RepID=A0ABR3X7D9_9PEZI